VWAATDSEVRRSNQNCQYYRRQSLRADSNGKEQGCVVVVVQVDTSATVFARPTPMVPTCIPAPFPRSDGAPCQDRVQSDTSITAGTCQGGLLAAVPTRSLAAAAAGARDDTLPVPVTLVSRPRGVPFDRKDWRRLHSITEPSWHAGEVRLHSELESAAEKVKRRSVLEGDAGLYNALDNGGKDPQSHARVLQPH
jgi:hypothetical protein